MPKDGGEVLRPVVQDYLSDVKSFGGPDLQRVVNQVQAMLSMDPSERPSVAECLERFDGVDSSSSNIFLQGYTPLMAPDSEPDFKHLKGMNVSFNSPPLLSAADSCLGPLSSQWMACKHLRAVT